MDEDDIQAQWMAEIGRRLRNGETGVKLQDVMQATGVRVEAPSERHRLWRDLWDEIEASGLVTGLHKSSQHSTFVDRVTLTDHGRDPANWK